MKVFVLILGFSVIAFGHGEDKLGPNQGFITMPGAFHVEVVPKGTRKFEVYLLDMNWENPSVQDSKLDIKVAAGKKSVPVNCAAQTNRFNCELPEGFSLKMGKLVVESWREGLAGGLVEYELPLKLKKTAGGGDSHAGHH